MKIREVMANEELFNRLKKLSFLVLDLADIVQNDTTITHEQLFEWRKLSYKAECDLEALVGATYDWVAFGIETLNDRQSAVENDKVF